MCIHIYKKLYCLKIGRTNKILKNYLVGNRWLNQKYNFDNLGHALMSLFVLSSKVFFNSGFSLSLKIFFFLYEGGPFQKHLIFFIIRIVPLNEKVFILQFEVSLNILFLGVMNSKFSHKPLHLGKVKFIRKYWYNFVTL